jgi:hypothetical protein
MDYKTIENQLVFAVFGKTGLVCLVLKTDQFLLKTEANYCRKVDFWWFH